MFIFDEKKFYKSKINKKDLLSIIPIFITFFLGIQLLTYSISLLSYPFGIYLFLIFLGGIVVFYIFGFFGIREGLKRLSKEFEA